MVLEARPEHGVLRRITLGLGSNLGTRWAYLASALEALSAIDADLAVSSVYETEPVGGPEQGPYLNCVAQLAATLEPDEVLALAQRLEREAGRVREVRWGPRTLDVDVLFLEREERGHFVAEDLSTPTLTVPHPRLVARAFVLAPLEEVAPLLAPADWRAGLGGSEAIEAAVRRVGAVVLGAR